MSDKMEFPEITPVSEEQISQENIDICDLWMIKTEDNNVYGPFDTKSLCTYSSTNEVQFETIQAYNFEDEQWKPFFKFPKFQRRKPKLVPIQSLVTSDDFLILINGDKKGPFSFDEVQQMVDSKKIALNVQVSLDSGDSWIKLYEHHAFDRRFKKKAQDLPHLPNTELLNPSIEIIHQKIAQAKNDKTQAEEDALVGLAFIGHGNDRGQIYKNDTNQENKFPKQSQTQTLSELNLPHLEWLEGFKGKLKPRYIGGGLFAILVLFSAFNSFNARFNSGQEIKAIQSEVKTEAKSINNSQRTATNIKQNSVNSTKKIVRARKYRPKAITRPETRRSPASTRTRKNTRTVYKEVHTDDRYDEMNIDDQEVKEELTRELAGDAYNENYEELSDEQKDFIERANQEVFSEGAYEQMEERDSKYEEILDFE